MTPLQWFKAKGHGSQKDAARKMGYSLVHINLVVNQRKPPSKFFISCLNKHCNHEFTASDFVAGSK